MQRNLLRTIFELEEKKVKKKKLKTMPKARIERFLAGYRKHLLFLSKCCKVLSRSLSKLLHLLCSLFSYFDSVSATGKYVFQFSKIFYVLTLYHVEIESASI